MAFPITKSDGGITCIIYTTNAGGNYPIHGAYHGGEGEWYVTAWRKDGAMFEFKETALDIKKAVLDGLFTSKKEQPEKQEEQGALQVETGSSICGESIQERTES